MSISDSTVKGKMNEVAGKVKQTFGEATGNESVANKGAAQEVKGHAEQSWGAVKEGVHDSTTANRPAVESDAHAGAHDIREKVTSTAANVKEHIKNATDPKR